jgi:SAM-dependent methyltransferase
MTGDKLPRWQLPRGVTRGVWDYVHDAELARAYDAHVAESPLTRIDLRFAEKHFAQAGRLVDLGCGTGRLLVWLAGRGFWTLGVDLSSEMLRVAGQRACEAGVAVHRLQANLVDLACLDDGCFDYAACLFSTLSMISGADARRSLVEHIARLLRPGGTFVLHVHNRWSNLWQRGARSWLIKDWLRSWLLWRPAGDHTAPPHEGLPALTLHLFTRGETKRLLTRAGFRIVEIMPLGLGANGRLRWPAWFGRLRAHGYLIAARKCT